MGLLNYNFAGTDEAKGLLALGSRPQSQATQPARSPMMQAFSMPASFGAQSANIFNAPKYIPKQMSWEQMTGQSQAVTPYVDWTKITGSAAAHTGPALNRMASWDSLYDPYKKAGGGMNQYDWYNFVYRPSIPAPEPFQGA